MAILPSDWPPTDSTFEADPLLRILQRGNRSGYHPNPINCHLPLRFKNEVCKYGPAFDTLCSWSPPNLSRGLRSWLTTTFGILPSGRNRWHPPYILAPDRSLAELKIMSGTLGSKPRPSLLTRLQVSTSSTSAKFRIRVPTALRTTLRQPFTPQRDEAR